MNTDFLQNCTSELGSMKTELINNLHHQISQIEIPRADSTNLPSTVERKSQLTPYLSAAGAAVLLIGLCSKSTFFSILGGMAVGAGVYMFYKDKPSSLQKPVQTQMPNFTVISSKINDAIRNIHSTISSDWDSFVSSQISRIKAQFITSSLTEIQSNKINDLLMTHSLISYPIMEVLPKLMSISRGKNVNEYSDFLKAFESDYISAITLAYTQQVSCLEKISEMLK